MLRPEMAGGSIFAHFRNSIIVSLFLCVSVCCLMSHQIIVCSFRDVTIFGDHEGLQNLGLWSAPIDFKQGSRDHYCAAIDLTRAWSFVVSSGGAPTFSLLYVKQGVLRAYSNPYLLCTMLK